MGDNKPFDVSFTNFLSLFGKNFPKNKSSEKENNKEPLYLIPIYQRPYAWERKHIEDFYYDIRNVLDKDIKNYIFGTVYLAKVKKENINDFVIKEVSDKINEINISDKVIYLIIDGQQRLITMWLFLKALKDKVGSLDYNLPEIYLGTENDYDFLVEEKYKSDKVSLDTHSKKLILDTYDFFSKNLEESNINLEKLKDSLKVIKTVINVEELNKEEENSFAELINIFVSQTDRGKRLTPFEKLKSLLIYYSNFADDSKGKNEEINKTFSIIYQHIDKLIENKVFKDSISAEENTMHLLNLLLFEPKKEFEGSNIYRHIEEKLKKKLSELENSNENKEKNKYTLDIWYESGEEKIYQTLNKAFRDLSQHQDILNEIKTLFDFILESLKQIKEYYEKLIENSKEKVKILGKDFPIKEFYGIYGSSRFSHYIALNLLKERELKDELSIYNGENNKNDSQQFSIEERKEKLGLDNIKKRLNLRINALEKEEVAEFLREYLINTKKYNSMFEEKAYVFNVLEFAEMFIWKFGYRPWGGLFEWKNFIMKNKNKLRFVFSHNIKCYRKEYYKYPIWSFRDDYFYVLAEYEKVNFYNNNNANEFEKIIEGLSQRPRKFQREHFFSISANKNFKEIFNEVIENEYKEYIKDENLYSSAEDRDKDLNYDKWIDNIGNIFLLKADLNLDAKNRSILKKAKKYSEKAEIKGTKSFMKEKVVKLQELLEIDENFFEEELDKDKDKTKLVVKAFKLLIDIRHYKILEFFAHRF